MSDHKLILSQVKTLLVDAVYEGGRSGNAADDPIHPLLGVGNQGGFRHTGPRDAPTLITLSSSLKDTDWPDNIDKENGIYTYYGDNKTPGKELHDTSRGGNGMLRDMFERARGGKNDRLKVPPILIFHSTGNWRDVEFIGLAVPGTQDLDANTDLVALWRLKDGKRFQNYQAKLTILDVAEVPLSWIEDVRAGNPLTKDCPPAWRLWAETGRHKPLKAPRTITFRKKEEQLPSNKEDLKLIHTIQQHFQDKPVMFELCAARIVEILMNDTVKLEVTQPSVDGGFDAFGKYRIGEGASAILVDFVVEAKCYELSNPVTVKDVSRLISRIRHRQFGILVTTSYLATQAYKEIKEDEHPIIIISAIDIVRILKAAGLAEEKELRSWLSSFYNP